VSFDPYRILGVSQEAAEGEIRQLYRALARRYHPDLNKSPEAEEVFKELGLAFAVLTNPRKRELFDRFGEASMQVGFDPRQFEAPSRPAPRRRDPARDPAPGVTAHRTGEPAWNTARERRESLQSAEWSTPVGARAAREPERSAQSVTARGAQDASLRGARPDVSERSSRAAPGHNLDVLVPLEIDLHTAIIGGEVRVDSPLTGAPLSLLVPPGVESGHQVRLEGWGRPGRGRAPGDLYFELQVQPHPFFHREGADLVLELPVTIEEAYLGARVQIPTLQGWVRVGIPAGSRGGERLRLRGKGLPHGQAVGDLHVHICIRLPQRLDSLGRNLDRIGALYTQSVREGLKL